MSDEQTPSAEHPAKPKKQEPSTKQKIVGSVVILFIIIVGIAALGGGNDNKQPKKSVNSSAKTAETSKPSSESKPPERQVKGKAVTLGAGTFTGGKDVTVGLYDVTPGSGQSGNFIVSGSDNYNEILGNDSSLSEVPKARVQISSGDKIEISGLSQVSFTPVTVPFITDHKTVNLYAGTFVVGEDIGAGRYVATPGSGQSGNFIVSGSDSYNEILGSDSSLGEVPSVSVTLSKGDIVDISGLSQVTMTASK